MLTLKHCNGTPLIKLYGTKDPNQRGANFLVHYFDRKGVKYRVAEIESRANAVGICLRTGCFCNPGIDELNNNITNEELQGFFQNETGTVEGNISLNPDRLLNVKSHLNPENRGAVRISMGIATNWKDLQCLIAFSESFLNKSI